MDMPRDPAASAGLDGVPEPDNGAEPAGYVVLVPPGARIHFLDWTPEGLAAQTVVMVHGLAGTAHVWAPVARRLSRIRRIVALDLRGHGLSDAPTEGYDAATLAGDIVAAWAARDLGVRCAGLVLVDGGWEDLATSTGLDPAEFLRTLEEPPEVLRSLKAYLADRAEFDRPTWDADQEAAARAAVVELPAGKVVSATRPHAMEGSVHAMFAYRPLEVLAGVTAPIAILSAAEDEAGGRAAALDRLAEALASTGRPLARRRSFPSDGHNLMRYRPVEVAATILDAADWPVARA